MSQAEVERFVEDLKNDEELRTELSAQASGIGPIVAFANDKGYDVSAEEANAYISGQAGRELNDAELDMVAGGKGHNETSTSSAQLVTNVHTTVEAEGMVVAVGFVVVVGSSAPSV